MVLRGLVAFEARRQFNILIWLLFRCECAIFPFAIAQRVRVFAAPACFPVCRATDTSRPSRSCQEMRLCQRPDLKCKRKFENCCNCSHNGQGGVRRHITLPSLLDFFSQYHNATFMSAFVVVRFMTRSNFVGYAFTLLYHLPELVQRAQIIRPVCRVRADDHC